MINKDKKDRRNYKTHMEKILTELGYSPKEVSKKLVGINDVNAKGVKDDR